MKEKLRSQSEAGHAVLCKPGVADNIKCHVSFTLTISIQVHSAQLRIFFAERFSSLKSWAVWKHLSAAFGQRVMGMSQFVRDAITKHHRQGAQTIDIYFSQFRREGSPRSRWWQIHCLVRALFMLCRILLLALSSLVRKRDHLSCVSSYKDTNPS